MPSDDALDVPLIDLELLIVDCQTTGASPAQGSVLELGLCRTRASLPAGEASAEAHWVLPKPGERVSAQVRQLTGFHEGVLESALSPEAAWQRLRAVAGAGARVPTAIHFARFELAFLKDWAARWEPDGALPLDAVCVHAIACKLYPSLPRRNLRALAGFLGHGLHLERRALGHVLATAFIWEKLAHELTARGVTRFADVAPWLLSKEPSAPRKRRYPIAPASYRALPDLPGVYRFLRSNGDLLYVGKAASLKRRVSSHFTKQSGATERALEMLTQVSEIAFTPTATALEAALLETRTIKELNPPYNVQLIAGDRGAWFSSADFSHASQEPDAQHPLGPLSSRHSLRALGALTRLLGGETPSDSLRAGSVGAPLRWAPDEASFTAGFRSFLARHAGETSEGSPRRRALELGRRLLAVTPEEPEASDEGSLQDAPKTWDEARVCRHLERASAQAFRVLRRASWLRLLASASVAYREPGAEQTRVLLLHETRIASSGELTAGATLPEPPRRDAERIARAFDAASYDSLRILTTELKRILRDGGDVSVRISRSRQLRANSLSHIFALV